MTQNSQKHELIERCIIVSGMSGAGKSQALDVFEDQGFYVIDNLPPSLLPQLLDVLVSHQSAVNYGVAAVIDVRGENLFTDLENVFLQVRKRVKNLDILFVDANDDCLVRRFETTRRRHPLNAETTILDSIAKERELLKKISACADVVIDTSLLNLPDFRIELLGVMGMAQEEPLLIISSFGFKYGIPKDSDYVFDVRFLPNPNYVEELHLLSGKDTEIHEYLKKYEALELFLDKAKKMLEYVSSVYCSTGKKQLHVAIGCTGGRHRSVAVAEMLAQYFKEKDNKAITKHRDIEKGNTR